MSPYERPSIRPHLEVSEEGPGGRFLLVHDRLRLSEAVLRVPRAQLHWMALFDGSRTLRDIQAEAFRLSGGEVVPLGLLEEMARQLDEALFLDSPRFRALADAPVRPPSCIGAYEGDPEALRRQLRDLFTHPGGAGLPGEMGRDDSLGAVLAPHIDYARGGLSYTFAFKEVFERTRARLFVVVGTSHYSPCRLTLTRKHFQTPLGVVPTDQAFIDRVVARYGDGLFDDEWLAHLPEHSIELEVVFLQYLFEGKRDFRIVPLVVGSFHDCVSTGQCPETQDDLARMVAALQAAEREAGEPVCYVISGDLAHIGPKFGDRQRLDGAQLALSRHRDEALLARLRQADRAGYFESVAEERDARRICGLPPTWLTLAAAEPRAGRVLHYGQYAHPQGRESVSFASVAFDRSEK